MRNALIALFLVACSSNDIANTNMNDMSALQGDMAGERDGVVRGHAKVDAAKAAKAK